MTIIVDDAEVVEALATVEDLEYKLLPQMEDLTDRLREYLQEYPAEPAGSSYQRTGDLGNSWLKEIFVSADQLTGRVQSSGVPYAGLVQDRSDQAWMHRNRWQTRQDVAERNEEYALELFDNRVQLLIS